MSGFPIPNGTYAAAGLPAPAAAAAVSGRYDPARNLYGVTGANVRRFRAALAKAVAGTGQVEILAIGDSTTSGQGTGVVKSTTSYPAELKTLLLSSGLPGGGTGRVPISQAANQADSRWGGFVGTWNDASLWRQAASNGAVGVFTSDVAGTVMQLWYDDQSGPFTYKIDAAAPVTVTPGHTNAVLSVTVTGLANTTHTVTVTTTTAATVGFYFCEIRQTSGVSVSNFGIPGNTTGTWQPSAYGNPLYDAIVVNPDLTLVNLGINDYFTSVAVATTQANLTSICNSLTPTSDVILAIPNPTSTVATPAWSLYEQAIYAVAQNLSLPVLDLTDRWQSYTLANGSGLMSADGTHPNVPGYADIARGWASALLS